MSKGNINTSGNKKNNFPYQQSVLLLLDALITASSTEQDVEILLVRDTGNGDVVVQQIIDYSGSGAPVMTYKDVDGVAYVPVGPLEYLDPAGVTNLVLTHSAVSYTDLIPHNTTLGKNTVMITCVTGVEDIAGIVRPAGVYTFQPTLNNTVAVIVVNANGGQVIIDEL